MQPAVRDRGNRDIAIRTMAFFHSRSRVHFALYPHVILSPLVLRYDSPALSSARPPSTRSTSRTENPLDVFAACSLTAAFSSFLASEVDAEARGIGTVSSWLAVELVAVAVVVGGLRLRAVVDIACVCVCPVRCRERKPGGLRSFKKES